jgi:hypothetical protein
MLGLAIENRQIAGKPAGERFGARSNNKIQVLLNQIAESIPTHAVIFDVSTDRGIRSGNQTLTEIMYRLLLGSLGYARDLDLAELEIGLEGDGRLKEFKSAFLDVTGKEWDDRKELVAFSLAEASATMHRIDPAIYQDNDSWSDSAKGKADINPGKLAERGAELIARRKPGHTLMYVVDEVGQFVARDVQKMLDLQAIVQQLGVKGQGKQWLVVTSQEKLSELTGGLDDRRVELARLMDRFPQPLQVHLEPSDISEVTGKRVLAKNAAAQKQLGELYEQHRGQLANNTRLSADITLPELSRDGFVDLYPLLPYQIDLIIQVVSGLRTQGGASKHVGGANRTIIKLAQQLLIHPEVGLGSSEVGQLARIDQIYDLVESTRSPIRCHTRWLRASRKRSASSSSSKASTAPPRTSPPPSIQRSTLPPNSRPSKRRCASSRTPTSSATAKTATASRPPPKTTGTGCATARPPSRVMPSACTVKCSPGSGSHSRPTPSKTSSRLRPAWSSTATRRKGVTWRCTSCSPKRVRSSTSSRRNYVPEANARIMRSSGRCRLTTTSIVRPSSCSAAVTWSLDAVETLAPPTRPAY